MSVNKVFTLFFVAVVFLSGCSKKNWVPSWKEAGPATKSASSDGLFAQALKAFEQATDEDGVRATIKVLHQVLAEDPSHREALAYLGNLHILLGTAYTSERGEKIKLFQEAMKYCELSMYANPQFRVEVDGGKKPWEAAQTLQAEDAQAMIFWVVALQYEFKEGMSMPEKIANIGWLKHGIVFLDQIVKVAPDFGNGSVEFAYSICFSAIPTFLGGDIELGKAYLERSILRGEGYLLPRWGRGKYFAQVTGDTQSARQDLQWVASQKIEDFKDPLPWRSHFIKDSKIQLDSL